MPGTILLYTFFLVLICEEGIVISSWESWSSEKCVFSPTLLHPRNWPYKLSGTQERNWELSMVPPLQPIESMSCQCTPVTVCGPPIVNGGVKCKRWSGNNATLFLPYLPPLQRSVTQLFCYPIGQSHYSKCWLFRKFIKYILVSSSMQAQFLAKDTHYSEHWIPPPDIWLGYLIHISDWHDPKQSS